MLLDAESPMLREVAERLLSTSGILLSVCIVLLTMAILSMHGSLFSGPGPWGVPILGYYPFLKKNLHIQLHEMTKKYGHVYKLNVCGQTFVYMDTMKAIRESHITKSEHFPHRNDKSSVLSGAFKEGLVLVKGEHWKVLRKFMNQSLRELGISTNKAELREPVEEAVKTVLDSLAKSKGNQINLTALMCKESTKAVVRLFLGNDVSDENVTLLHEAYFDLFMPFTDGNLLLAGNFARYAVTPWITSFDRFRKGLETMQTVLQKILDHHKANFDPDQQPTDVIGAYLREKALREKKGDPTAKYFTDQSLISTLMQAYGDGSTGIGLFVSTYIFELSKHSDVQDAIYEEIVNVVGTERLPNLEDRSKMPYTISAIKEALRMSNLFPLFPGLECVRDTTVQGVNVPKGSVVLLNYWGVHNDPEVYENPKTFDATRFLPEKPKVESPIAFGVGKRSCAGEALVMAEFFLFLTAIFQSFIVSVEEQAKGGSIHEEEGCLVRVTSRRRGRYGSLTKTN